MKVLLLCSALISILSFSSRSQPYSNYINYQTEWHEYVAGFLTNRSFKNYRIKVNGDTLINSKWYFKLSACLHDSTIYNPNDSLLIQTIVSDTIYYIGNLREDAQRRFYYMPNGSNNETILYNFNLSIGNNFPISSSCYVNSIDTILIGQVPRKRFRFNTLGTPPIIEGIGSLGGVLFGYTQCGFWFDSDTRLVCYKNQNDSIDFNQGISCSYCPNFVTSSSSFKEIVNDINIFPNPTSSHIRITFSLKQKSPVKIKISDNNGSLTKVVLDETLEQGINELNFDFSKYSEGIYFIQITSDENIFIKKVIVVN